MIFNKAVELNQCQNAASFFEIMFGKEKPDVHLCHHFTDVGDLSTFYSLNCFFILTLLAQISNLVCESIKANRVKTVLASSGLK